MKKALVRTHGYFGDIIFATTIAERLKKERGYDVVDYLIGYPQVEPLISPNPYIDDVYSTDICPTPYIPRHEFGGYDIFSTDMMEFIDPPPVQMQKQCGFRDNFITEYRIYPDQDLVRKWRETFLQNSEGKPIVTWGRDLYNRSFEFTKEEYDRGIDVPNKGYGGRLRDIDFMIRKLSERYYMVEVGAKYSTQRDVVPKADDKTISEMAAMMQASDVYFGTEGGLINIAAGVDIPTVMMSEFVHQLYGPNGVIKKMEEPKLGPSYYFGSERHKVLPLYKNTDELTTITGKYLAELLS